MILSVFIIIFVYSILVLWFTTGIGKLKSSGPNYADYSTYFSIVIPFRNESQNLSELLTSINLLEYPEGMFEVLFIDDDSNDDSVAIITNFIKANTHLHLYVIPNERHSNSPKKDAITTAIKKATNNWIVTTDADCVLPSKWLNSFDRLIKEKHPEFIAGPVTYKSEHTFLNAFQLLDIHSLQGVTMGTFGWKQPFLCNGANLAYKKEAFYNANGFLENNYIASGDDVFLMEKIIKLFPEKVCYLKNREAIVYTNSQDSLKSLINQRVRWASKTAAYRQLIGKFTALIVLLTNLCLILFFIGFATSLISLKVFTFLILIKIVVDFPILYKMALFFRQKNQLNYYILSSLLYPFFNTYIAFKSIFFNYEWKGRKFNK